jgi:diguanylate cyclase (GGDEF)-like protein/PAS domain S-box-containing protein
VPEAGADRADIGDAAGVMAGRVPLYSAVPENDFLLLPGDGLLLVAASGTIEYLDPIARQRLGAPPASRRGSRLASLLPQLAVCLAREAPEPGAPPCDRELALAGAPPLRLRLFRTDTGFGVGCLDPAVRAAGTPLQGLLASLLAEVTDSVIVTTAYPAIPPGPVIVWANAAAERQTGHPLQVMLGRSPRLFQGDCTQAEDRLAFRRAIRSWQTLTQEIDNVRADGTPFRVEISLSPLSDANGCHTHWVSVQRDVTEQRRAARRLRNSEEHFRLLAENVTDLVVRLADDGTVLWASPSLRIRLGWDSAALVGRSVFSLLARPRDLAGRRADLAGLRQGRMLTLRHRVRDQQGDLHWLETHASPWRDAAGRPDGVVASSRLVDSEVAAEQELQRRARTDDLTGLLNRCEILERLDRLLRLPHDRGLAVLFCDLDGFKAINDRHGHLAGDALLRAVAQRLRQGLRGGDLVARVGGDELVVVLAGVRQLADAERVADVLRRRVAAPVDTGCGPLAVTASIGVTLLQPGDSVDALIARADQAMYAAKQAGRNRVIPIGPA